MYKDKVVVLHFTIDLFRGRLSAYGSTERQFPRLYSLLTSSSRSQIYSLCWCSVDCYVPWDLMTVDPEGQSNTTFVARFNDGLP